MHYFRDYILLSVLKKIVSKYIPQNIMRVSTLCTFYPRINIDEFLLVNLKSYLREEPFCENNDSFK